MNYFLFDWYNIFDAYIIILKVDLIIFVSVFYLFLFHLSIVSSDDFQCSVGFCNTQGKHSGKLISFFLDWKKCVQSVHHHNKSRTRNRFFYFIIYFDFEFRLFGVVIFVIWKKIEIIIGNRLVSGLFVI